MVEAYNRKIIRDYIVTEMTRGKELGEVQIGLEKEFGVKKSLTSIHGIYKRASTKQKDVMDILRIYARGYNISETKEIYKELTGDDKSYYAVRKIVNDNQESIDKILNAMGVIAIKCIDSKMSLEEISNELTYKGVVIKEKYLKDVICWAYDKIIRNNNIKLIAEAYELTGDNDVVKDLIRSPREGITLGEIKYLAKD